MSNTPYDNRVRRHGVLIPPNTLSFDQSVQMEVDDQLIEDDVEEGTLFQQENSEPEVKRVKSESSSRYYSLLKNLPPHIPFYEVDPPEIMESTTRTEWLYFQSKKKGKDKEDKKDKKQRVQWKMGGRANYWPKDNPMMLTQYGTATEPAMKRRISFLLKKRDNITEECSVWEKELQSLKQTKKKSSTKEVSNKHLNLYFSIKCDD